MTAYYNEIDPYAAQWLRNLIAAGHIADGIVDERSIEDVTPKDLYGFTQCHFFAGVGVWSLALRNAGWRDNQPVWTGSCPCQPFSTAGKGSGFADERHLWPAFHHLIEQCQPPVVLGEQVASKDADPWIDLVQADMETLGYAFGAIPFPSAGVGAPHIRDRLYWVADAQHQGPQGRVLGRKNTQRPNQHGHAGCDGATGGLDNTSSIGRNAQRNANREHDGHQLNAAGELSGRVADAQRLGLGQQQRDTGAMGRTATPSEGKESKLGRVALEVVYRSEAGGLADDQLQQRPDGQPRVSAEHDASGRVEGSATVAGLCSDSGRPGPTNGHWRAADWLLCRDGKWRPVEPGTFPLAHGAPARVGRLRAYGNAINAKAAQAFIEAVIGS